MLIKLLRNTVADGRQVGAGQVVDVTEATGKTLVQMGKAVDHPSPVGRGAGGEGEAPAAKPVVEKVADPLPIVPIPSIEIEAIAPAKPKGRQGKK